MKRVVKSWSVLALIMAMSAGSVVCWAAGEAAVAKQAKGDIILVDPTTGSLALKPADPAVVEPTQFVIDAKTVISKNNQALKASDLKPGDSVTVEYTASADNKLVAGSIEVQPVAAPAVAATQAPAGGPSAPAAK